MSHIAFESADLSRRGLLRVALVSGAFLTAVSITASLSGCSAEQPAVGMQKIRRSDLPFLYALLPVMLFGAVPSE